MATRVFIYEPQKSFYPKPQTTIFRDSSKS
jgi:hypothetical protein